MKAVIYARYSSDNQREESIEGQIRECTAFAEKNDITVLKHYIDRAYSARTDHRPAFQEMIKDSDKHLFDMVIVWKLDRFSRDRYDSARYKVLLKKNNVRVVSATEVISSGADGILLESVLEGFAEYYSADLAEKVNRGMSENVLNKKCNGGTRPVGYVVDKEHHFQIDPLTAPFVLEAFNQYAEWTTMKEISNYLKEKGVKNTWAAIFSPAAFNGCSTTAAISGNTPSAISSFQTVFLPLCRKSCLTVYRKRWRKTEKPLPDIRRRTIIC